MVLSAASAVFSAIETIRDLRFGRSIVDETNEILDRAERATDAAILMYNEEHVRRREVERKLELVARANREHLSRWTVERATTEELVRLGWDAFETAKRGTEALSYEEAKAALDVAVVEAVANRVRAETPKDLLTRMLQLELSLEVRPGTERGRWNVWVSGPQTRHESGALADSWGRFEVGVPEEDVPRAIASCIAEFEADDRAEALAECGPTSPERSPEP